ncbi:MAG: putative Ig domain-containing protein [Pseudomonadota bacterium]
MYASSRLLPQLILIVSLGITATSSHAVAPTKDPTCFSNLQITLFAKESLPSLQSIDPTVSLTDAKNVIKSVGDCITLEAATLAIDEYAASLSPNSLPTISGTPITSLVEGESYSFLPTASDADGDSLVFSILNAPTWASFDASSGALSGTPGFDDAGSYGSIVISVSDGTVTVSLSAFSIDVFNTNRAPSISGTPLLSVAVNEIYSFIPSAIDPDGDLLTFDILNLPSWASFDPTTGELSGTPTTGGVYTDIEISVSDGMITTALSTISISVVELPVADVSANLTWVSPTTRTDGSFLTISEIGGYRIYMGQTQDNLNMIVDLNGGLDTSYNVPALTTGTYYFAVTAYDIDGNESSFSNVAVKNI